MSLFSRKFNVDFRENPDESLLVTSRMEDELHDITLELVISRPELMIRRAEVRMERIPGTDCRDICPVINQLEGLTITSGFTKKVVALLKDGGGCPNVQNLIMLAAPLAVNIAMLADFKKGRLDHSQIEQLVTNSLDGVCVGFRSGKASS
jgi:hypothetical protein